MGNRSSIISMTLVPGPKDDFSQVYDHLEAKGCQFQSGAERNLVEMTCPQGWAMYRDYGFDNEFYLFDDNRVLHAVFREKDNDKYRDYSRSARLWRGKNEYMKTPFTYPLPDFYVSNNGYLEINKESDMYAEITFVKDYIKTYNKYLSSYYELDAEKRTSMLNTLLEGRDKLKPIVDTEYMTEHGKSQSFLLKARKYDVLPLTFDEIINYMTTSYAQLLTIKCAIVENKLQHGTVAQFRELYDDFFEHLKYTYSAFFESVTDFEYKTNQSYLELPDQSELVFVVKNVDAIGKARAMKEFERLVADYYRTANYVAGCGPRCQGQLDDEYKKIQGFLVTYPEFRDAAPKRIINSNDGSGGVATGLGMLAGGLY
jgi:hypothetical protein